MAEETPERDRRVRFHWVTVRTEHLLSLLSRTARVELTLFGISCGSWAIGVVYAPRQEAKE